MNLCGDKQKNFFNGFEKKLSVCNHLSTECSLQSYQKNPQRDIFKVPDNLDQKAKIALTTTIGVVIPYLIQKKLLGVNSANSNIAGIGSTALGSIIGALSGAALFNKSKFREKLKESVYLFSTIMIPSMLTATFLNIFSPGNKFKGVLPMMASIFSGVLIGMPLASELSKKVNDTFIKCEKPDDRKLCINDYFVHIDDLLVGMSLAKVPFLSQIHADKLIPSVFGYFGYKIGVKDL